jgi:hypothetical protein
LDLQETTTFSLFEAEPAGCGAPMKKPPEGGFLSLLQRTAENGG